MIPLTQSSPVCRSAHCFFCSVPHFPTLQFTSKPFLPVPNSFLYHLSNLGTLSPVLLKTKQNSFIVSFLPSRPFIWECFSEDIFRGLSGVWHHYQLLYWHGGNWEFIVQCCKSCGVHVPGKDDERTPEFSVPVVSAHGSQSEICWGGDCCCSVTQLDCGTPDFPVLHHLPELAQTHVHWVGDAIQPSHPLSSPSSPDLNLSQHQGLFQWVGSSHQVAKVLEFQLQHQSFQWIFRVDSL